jgi:hypothetical protein
MIILDVGGTSMKDIKKKIKEYDQMLEEGDVSDPIADQILMDLDAMINDLENIVSDNLDNIDKNISNE